MHQDEEVRIVSITLPSVIADRVEKVDARLNQSRDWVVARALSEWLLEEAERDRRTREALSDVDCGRTKEHATVQAWAGKLVDQDSTRTRGR